MDTLDKFDWAILEHLQADGRLSNAELAQRVGLSAAPCWRRMRALETSGFIRGYRADIDRHKIGLGVLAFVRVDAERTTGDLTRVMEDAIRAIPEIISCHYISGSGTFELQVVARDLDSFSTFARGAAEPAERERPAHELLAWRGEGGRRVADRAVAPQARETGGCARSSRSCSKQVKLYRRDLLRGRHRHDALAVFLGDWKAASRP